MFTQCLIGATDLMRIALSLWNDRIAPVFDVAQNLLLVEIQQGVASTMNERRFSCNDLRSRALRLSSLQVEQLVCGAISREAELLLSQHGITVHSFIAGELHQVVTAFLEGRLYEARLAMPGCSKTRWRGQNQPHDQKTITQRMAHRKRGTRPCQTETDRDQSQPEA